jgi:GNAT superfamily N-acetyltransferase
VTDIVIRLAGDADLHAITRLRVAWTREQDGAVDDPGFDDRLTQWYARESSRRLMWLAQADGELVGMMNLVVFDRMPRPGRAPSHWGYLGNAFVLAAYRNQGIGGRLLDALLEYADLHGFVRVVLSPSARSVPFYQRAGFRPADSLLLRTPAARTASQP